MLGRATLAIDDEQWRRLTARRPHVSLSRQAFAAYLGDQQSLDHLDELFLACAAYLGDRAAIAVIEGEHFDALRAAIERIRPRSTDLDDLLQGIRELLFVRLKIRDYAGRGPLAAWLRVVAIRHAVRARRKRAEQPMGEGLEKLPEGGTGADPELAYLRNAYRDVFQTAFRTALSALADEDRRVLRYHYVDGLTIDQLGAVLDLHRVSASRRIHRARSLLVTRTRTELRRTHFETSSELESILRAVESEVELSIKELFAPPSR